jgi:uncharacterized protein YegL
MKNKPKTKTGQDKDERSDRPNRTSEARNDSKPTLICFLLDRTGSMSQCRDETISGFNAYIRKIREELPDTARFTMMQFDSQGYDMLYERDRLSEVKDLTRKTYVPRANTPLWDATGKLISITRERVHSWAGGADGKYKVLFVSLTDGMENASSEWTLARVKELIKEMETSHKWTFAHIGTGIDGWSSGNLMYAGTQSVSNVARGTHANIDKAFDKLAQATALYASSKTSGLITSSALWGKAGFDLDKDEVKKPQEPNDP